MLSTTEPEVRKTLGDGIEKVFRKHLKRQRISYLPGCHITNLHGDNELEGIYFHKEGDFAKDKTPDTEYFIQPDLVICANGIDMPRRDLKSMVGHQEQGSERKVQLGGYTKIPHTNIRFSLIHNDIDSPIFAVGSACEIPSFIFKNRSRSDNVGFNMEAAYFAGLTAINKRVEFRHVPHTYLTLNENPVHFVGEPNQRYSEVVVEGDLNSDKFIVYYVWGEEIVGFLTFGY